MSFKNAHLPIQRTILNYAKTDFVHAVLTAILLAARQNNRITATDFGSEDGKLRELKINYIPPICDADGDCNANICNTGTVIQPKQEYFKLSKCTASPVLTVRLNDIRNLDTIGADEYSLSLIANLLQTVRTNLAEQITALLVANAGCHIDGNTDKKVVLFNQTTGAINPVGKAIIEKEFADAKLGRPLVVGGSSVYYAKAMQPISGLNANGLNLGSPLDNFYYDTLVNEAYPSGEHLLAFDPMVFKFIPFNFNVGRFATDLRSFSPETMFKSGTDWYSGTILDPATGILWDLDAIYDKCDKVWNFQFKLNWDIFFMPSQVCNIPCVNGIFHFTSCEMIEQECPTGTVVAPATAKTYVWDAAAVEFPLYVAKVQLGGRYFEPNVTVNSAADLVAMLNGLGAGNFTLNGTNVTYSGYSALTGNINEGVITITFVED